MTRVLERIVVLLVVLWSLAVVLKTLLPFAWRVALAKALAGKVPDRLRVWLAGRSACDACARR
jgi:hypothetical protein